MAGDVIACFGCRDVQFGQLAMHVAHYHYHAAMMLPMAAGTSDARRFDRHSLSSGPIEAYPFAIFEHVYVTPASIGPKALTHPSNYALTQNSIVHAP